MSENINSFVFLIKKINRNKPTFGKEITAALLIKFLLLGFLWWFFFAGTKQPVNDERVANKFLGVQRPGFSSSNLLEKP